MTPPRWGFLVKEPTMAERSYPFVSGTTTDIEFSKFMQPIVGYGVCYNTGSPDLRVTGDSSGLNVKVAIGEAFVRGVHYINDAIKTVAIAAGSANPRIDAIVLRLVYGSTNTVTVQVVQGTAAASPVAPTITKSDTGTTELLLALVNVPANAATITAGNVVDQRQFVGAFWTTAQRPTRPGSIGYNSSLNQLEATLDGTNWKAVTLAGDAITASQISTPQQALLNAGSVNGVSIYTQSMPSDAPIGSLYASAV